jgi:hypothetical protein
MKILVNVVYKGAGQILMQFGFLKSVNICIFLNVDVNSLASILNSKVSVAPR